MLLIDRVAEETADGVCLKGRTCRAFPDTRPLQEGRSSALLGKAVVLFSETAQSAIRFRGQSNLLGGQIW